MYDGPAPVEEKILANIYKYAIPTKLIAEDEQSEGFVAHRPNVLSYFRERGLLEVPSPSRKLNHMLKIEGFCECVSSSVPP